ncbi:MarR family winged helix-turn-helix transcriptional regulator [Paenibacillus senegalimassiliensis]|uniref:MarR family winged helix-turn-helix transcriptional regulator n=1 Tax=Paenibacillus senegalimassiliensis TaxID=1737426 RepID=UPI00073F87A4|nr:MarR family transcriptional regulator [Paenibacillus senegalimassiliensis]
MEYDKIIRSFGILNRTFVSYVSEALSSSDISFSDSIFLINIGNDEGTSQEQLAHLLAIDKAAIARSVKTMENKGYVKTERSKVDKRTKALYLSESGRELYQYLQGLNREWILDVLQDIDEEEAQRFIDTIDRISDRAKSFERRI